MDHRKEAIVNYNNITEVVGLDLSLTATGMAWAKRETANQSPPVVNFRCIKPPIGLIGLPRLSYIRDAVIPWSMRMLAVIEGYAFGVARGHSQAHSLGELGGVVKLALHERGIPFVIVAPAALKKFVCGRGNADKAVMLKAIYQRFAIDTDDHNVADAIGLMYIGRALCGWYEPTTDAQRQVIEEIRTGKRAKKVKKIKAVETAVTGLADEVDSQFRRNSLAGN